MPKSVQNFEDIKKEWDYLADRNRQLEKDRNKRFEKSVQKDEAKVDQLINEKKELEKKCDDLVKRNKHLKNHIQFTLLYPNLRDLFKLFLSKYEQSRFSIKLFKLL
jgi:seryl-tRNA synthetase